jgi:hypothetical protein
MKAQCDPELLDKANGRTMWDLSLKMGQIQMREV